MEENTKSSFFALVSDDAAAFFVRGVEAAVPACPVGDRGGEPLAVRAGVVDDDAVAHVLTVMSPEVVAKRVHDGPEGAPPALVRSERPISQE